MNQKQVANKSPSIVVQKKQGVKRQSIEDNQGSSTNSKSKFWTSIFLKKTTRVQLEKLKVRRKCRSYDALLQKLMKDSEGVKDSI